jgi:hypothetical protein
MRDQTTRFAALCAAFGLIGALAFAGTASAQGKIVCWKDKAGKTIGCGDKVPPEFQSSATKELDSHGVTRKTQESVEDANQRRQREQDAARVKADDDKRILDAKRQDTALLETYSNEKEIDLKRDRDLGVLDLQIEQLTTALKSATQRYNEAKVRSEQADKNPAVDKSKKGPATTAKDDFARATADKERLEKSIESKQKEKEETRKRYADYKKRYAELRGSPQTSAKK